MLTFRDLLRNFKNEIELAIHDYEVLFANAGTDVPSHRGRNINDLMRIFRRAQEDERDLLDKVNDVHDEVEGFITGLYIPFLDQEKSLYETGSSRLKTALETIINKPQYSKEAFLRAHIRDLDELLIAVVSVITLFDG